MEKIENIYQIKGDFTDEKQQIKIIEYYEFKFEIEGN